MAKKKASDTPQSFLLGEQEVTYVGVDEDPGDTFRKTVVQVNAPEADPANQLMAVKADVVEDFTYPNTKRPSQKLIAAEGTLTTRRLAEESGVEAGQLREHNPED